MWRLPLPHLAPVLALALLMGLLAVESRVHAQEPTPPEEPTGEPVKLPSWEWSKRDLKRIAVLEKKVQRDETGMWIVEGDPWNVATDISPRFAAEAAYYVTLYWDTFTTLVPGQIRTRGAEPTALFFRHHADFREAVNSDGRYDFNYRWDDDDRWTEFAFYTRLDDPEDAEFTHFDRSLIQRGIVRLFWQIYVGQADEHPRWLKEGIRSYFRTWDLTRSIKDNLKEGMARSRFPERFKEATDDGVLGLNLLLGHEEKDFYDDDTPEGQRNLTLVESFFDFLIAYKRGKVFDEMAGRQARDLEDVPALDREEMAKLEPLWLKHVARLRKELP